MKIKLSTKKIALLLICAGCVFMLSQCNKSNFYDEFVVCPIVHYVPYAPYVPAAPPLSDHSSIAFIARTTYNSSDWSLYIMDKLGNNMRRLVNKSVACRAPIRSHCGTKLAFSTGTDLYLIYTDGTGLTLLDRNAGNMSWSPCERFIIYVRWCDTDSNNTHLIRYCIVSNTRAIWPTKGNVCNVQFSPCGRYIAYCATIETSMIPFHNHNIYIMDINGRYSRLIIKNAGTPRWSPQGDRIAYLSSGKENSSQIFVANADGSNQKQLTHTISSHIWPGSWGADGNRDPQWTPDGERIVYVSWGNERPEVFIMNADGSNQTRLTTAELRDEDPEITPDGNFILFASSRIRTETGTVTPAIYSMTLDGKDIRQLSQTGIHPVALR